MKSICISKTLKLSGRLFIGIFGFLFFVDLLCVFLPESVGKFMLYDDGGVYEPTPERLLFLMTMPLSAALIGFGFILLKISSKVASAKSIN
jgi:hypothetical protein